MEAWLIPLLLFTASMVVASLYGLSMYFKFFYWLLRRRKVKQAKVKPLDNPPMVSVLIPVYNEGELVRRTLDACLKMNYPKDRMEIVVVDDSTDETVDILKEYEAKHPSLVRVIRRESNEGRKVGALNYGLQFCKGKYILVLDADHAPEEDLLLKAIPVFRKDEKIAFVQSVWRWANASKNKVTKSFSTILEAHFDIDYYARSQQNSFPFFMGTAGVVKKEVVEELNGWDPEVLTEDVDFACRSYLRGYRGVLLYDSESYTLAPETIESLREQQYRWGKGQIQCLLKWWRKIVASKNMTLKQKVDGLLFMSYYLVVGLLFLTTFFGAVFFLFLADEVALSRVFTSSTWLTAFSLILVSCLGAILVYCAEALKKYKSFISLTNVAFAAVLGCGVSLRVFKGVMEALLGVKTPFIKTSRNTCSKLNLSLNTRRKTELVLGILGTIASLKGIAISFQLSLVPAALFSVFVLLYSIAWILAAVIK